MWETHHRSQASQNPTSLFFLEVERAAVQKNFQGFCDLLWIEGRSLDWIVRGTRVYSPVNVEADLCWQLCSRGKKIWEKNSLGLPGLGFILHLSFPHLPLEGAQLPAVQVLQVGVFSHPGPRRQLGPATDLGGFWVQPGVQGSLKRSPSNSLGRAGTVRALHFRTGIPETPVRVSHFRSSFFVSKGHCRDDLWQIPWLWGLYFLNPNCQTPANTDVLMGAIDWNIWNQNSGKSRIDVFPDQRKLSVTEPLGLPAPCQCCFRTGILWVSVITLDLEF